MAKQQLGTRHEKFYHDTIEELRIHYAKQGKIYTKAEIVENALDLLIAVEIDKTLRVTEKNI